MTHLDNDFGLKCPIPACGRSDSIDIAAIVWVRACNDGTDIFAAENGDHEWDDHSPAQCCACGHSGTVRDFDTLRRPSTQ
jgi:hypothetical protein